MAEYNEQFATINISLAQLQQITKVQIGYDTDGNFADVFTSGEYIDLTSNRSTEATYSANNATLTRVNVIKLVGKVHTTSAESVLAYRPLGYTLDIIPSDDSLITVHVTLFTNVDGQTEGSIELNYLEHSEALNPQTVHEEIYDLNYQHSMGTITNEQFPCIIKNNGYSGFDWSNFTDVQRKNNTPVYFAGRGHTYSNLLWYYWNPTKINNFLNLLADKFSQALANYTLSLRAKISVQNPFVGFNARYGSYLYWYNISNDYLCVIYAGSNHYNAVDIFITENTQHIPAQENIFYANNKTRIKFNRWYNNLYFIADNKAYQINTNLEDSHVIYSQEITESFNYVEQQHGSDELIYHIRAFQSEVQDAIQVIPLDSLDDSSTKYYQLDFSDIGDVVAESFVEEGQTNIALRNIFERGSGRSWNLNETIDATDLYDNTDNNVLYNKYTIDNPSQVYRLMGLYQTSLIHLQYFLKNDYTPVYMGEEFSIGKSQIYQNYLVLFKVPLEVARRRCPANWLDDVVYINHNEIKHANGSIENIYSGQLSYMVEEHIAASRGVCVLQNAIGAYRNIADMTRLFNFSIWSHSSVSVLQSNYDYDNYVYFQNDPDYSRIKLRFIDQNGNITELQATSLSTSTALNQYQIESPTENAFSSIVFGVNKTFKDIYIRFNIRASYRPNFPSSSVFASTYWNDDCTLKEGCSVGVTLSK